MQRHAHTRSSLRLQACEGQAGRVAAVLRTGYVMHERVLRAAQVGVSTLPEAAP